MKIGNYREWLKARSLVWLKGEYARICGKSLAIGISDAEDREAKAIIDEITERRKDARKNEREEELRNFS